jgi:hypothetical protein
MSSLRHAIWGASLAVSLVATPAHADDSEADAAIAQGVELRRRHMDVEALADFRRAYAIAPTPRALAQIALAEAALSRWVLAETDLLRAIAAEDEWIDRQRGVLQLALKEIQSHLSTLDVTGPEHAQVWVDGVLVAQLPTPPVRVPAKHLVVELRAPGFESARRELDAEAGSSLRADIQLQALPAAPAPSLVQSPIATPAPDPDAANDQPSRTLAWAVGGGAVALLMGGIASTLYGADRASRYNNTTGCDLQTKSAECQSYLSGVHTAEVLEVVAYSGAGAATFIAAVLFLTPARPRARGAGAWCVPTLGGAECGYAF